MKAWNQDAGLQRLRKLAGHSYGDLSEADTRAKLIDSVLKDVLGWDEDDIQREERCMEAGTFLDYKLSTNIPHIVVEAKKNGVDLALPEGSRHREYKIGGVLQNSKPLVAALIQARDYAVSKGITYCVVTNGTAYVFFRAFNQLGIEWTEHACIVFRDLADVAGDFDLFCRLLSKTAVEDGLLPRALPVTRDTEERSRFLWLDPSHLAKPRGKDRNKLFPYLGDVVHRVFQDLAREESDSEILEHCYVETPRKGVIEQPFFDRATTPVEVTKKEAGEFQKRVVAALTGGRRDRGEVLLLLGSVGVGKSTFIQRFRKVLAKHQIDSSGIWIYFNFKKFSDTGESLDAFIHSQVEESLNRDYKELDLFEWRFIKHVFHSEHERYKRGVLAPVFERSPQEFEEQCAQRIDQLIANNRGDYLERTLIKASQQFNKNIFLVFDNADQLNPSTQNEIFLVAQKLAETLRCHALIAMREESYWKNRDSGPLNAFHTTAYHVQPAGLRQVLSKRFQYVKKLLETESAQIPLEALPISREELTKVCDRLIQTLLGDDQRYLMFIESVAAGDMRRALDVVAAFLTSGHTNIDAIVADERKTRPVGFPVPFHEFLNALILRDHERYAEGFSDVLNLFQVSGAADANNFNRVAVLGRVLKAKNEKSAIGNGYIAIERVVTDCHKVGVLPETTSAILTLMVSRRLIETETTIRDDLAPSKYVRATIAGEFYLTFLVKEFEYLDAVLIDTPIGRDKPFKKLSSLLDEVAQLSSSNPWVRLERIKKRLEVCDEFINYLTTEFNACTFRTDRATFDINSTNIMPNVRSAFDAARSTIVGNAEQLFGRPRAAR